MENPRTPNCGGLILDRFHSMVKVNDDIVQIYDELLSELTINSKPIITELTMIAGDQREYAEGIADAIMGRILEVPVDQKLPSLYLLDSIVKNIGREYVRYFAARLPEVFCEAYNQFHSNMHPAMRHLFRTWSQVFPSSVLRKIENELQFSTTESQRPASQVNMKNSESPSPRPSRSIHVNPKYLEQFQHSAAMEEVHTQKNMHAAEFEDGTERFASESPKGWSGASPKFHDTGHDSGNSSRLQGYKNSSAQYGDYGTSNSEALPPQLGRSKAGTLQPATVRPSFCGAEGSVHRSNVKVAKPLSPPRLMLRKSESPIVDRLLTDGSPWRAVESATQPHSRPGFGAGKAIDQNDQLERSWLPVVGASQLDASMLYDPIVGYRKKHPRELIDAYGNYRGKDTCLEKLPKVQRINVNGINGESAAKNWRSFEEEEYMWENMSPTLADRSRLNSLPALGPSFESLNRRVGLSQPAANIHKHDFRGNNQHGEANQHSVYDPAAIVDDRIPVVGLGHGSVYKGGQNEQFHHYHGPHHVQEPGKFPNKFMHSSGELSSWRWGTQLPSVSVMTAANGQIHPSPYDNPPDVVVAYRPHQRISSIHSGSLNVETSGLESHLELRPFSPPAPPAAPTMWPLVHKSQSLPLLPVPPVKSQHSHIDSSKPVFQGPNRSSFLLHQQFESADGKTPMPCKVLPVPPLHAGVMQMNQQSQEVSDGMRTYNHGAHDGGYIPFQPAHLSSHFLAQPLNHLQMRGQVTMDSLPNKISTLTSSGTMHSMPETSSLVHGGVTPPLPAGPPPGPSHMGPPPQNTSSMSGLSASAFSGLISTLMAQGVISLTPAAPPKDSVGLEFNAERLKVRYESAINALYTDLPRQCTTCGLRFKCQEEHSNHMDWHVTKNRVSKNRKQKPSRKWFVNTKEWLSGAETVGTEVVPFLPMEVVTEKKEDKEMSVPADENQTVCALCGEPFEDFYSDDAEEWMYKGAVYLNAPSGDIDGLDGSQLGPIVHAKCRSGASEGS